MCEHRKYPFYLASVEQMPWKNTEWISALSRLTRFKLKTHQRNMIFQIMQGLLI